MKNRWKRLLAGSLALVLAAGLSLPSLAVETQPSPGDPAQPLDVATGTYTPDLIVTPGGLYTLIALPASVDGPPADLTAAALAAYSQKALFIGSAVADELGQLTFEDVRLRTAQAAVYYVTGPDLPTPHREATGVSSGAEGNVTTASRDHSATITLVDQETGYRYNSVIDSDATGYYTTGNLAPAKYQVLVEKPGYLPYLSGDNYLDVTGPTSVIYPVNITANVGDVTGDGLRDMEDLVAPVAQATSTKPVTVGTTTMRPSSSEC